MNLEQASLVVRGCSLVTRAELEEAARVLLAVVSNRMSSEPSFITTPPWLALLAKLLDDEVAAEDAWKAAEAAWKKDRMNVDLMRAHDKAKLRYDKAERDTAQVATLRNVREVVAALIKAQEPKP